jgi:hypothetical protein
MTLMGLLIALRAAHARIIVEGDDLIVDAPRWALNEVMRQAIKEHKQALLTLPRPYLTASGELISPCDALPQYHWQPLTDTLRELNAPRDVWERYTRQPYGRGSVHETQREE